MLWDVVDVVGGSGMIGRRCGGGAVLFCFCYTWTRRRSVIDLIQVKVHFICIGIPGKFHEVPKMNKDALTRRSVVAVKS